MFPPSPHLSNSPANTQAVFPSAVAEWGVGVGAGGKQKQSSPVQWRDKGRGDPLWLALSPLLRGRLPVLWRPIDP